MRMSCSRLLRRIPRRRDQISSAVRWRRLEATRCWHEENMYVRHEGYYLANLRISSPRVRAACGPKNRSAAALCSSLCLCLFLSASCANLQAVCVVFEEGGSVVGHGGMP
ncbi:hypothetical protein PLEOSDRAFT_1090176 [Pleurotus ostreatus PC15]|uniref:Uncharacterized protein n=1 Tax=Pleurotus ostreatus (strain PC15) TaxID=1137138 RepID=A0A067NDH2_PLEO1|nr:hypothetical protein PLEOSDRAFT_1090176 [Pleurotus ostreatus PC15]